MRSTFDFDPAGSGSSDQSRQYCLKHKSSAARRANGKTNTRPNLSSLEPSATPSTSALSTSFAAWTAVKWRCSSPSLPICANVFDPEGFSVTSDKLSELRSICPPSPKDPTIRIAVSAFRTSVFGILIHSRKPRDAECARFRSDQPVPPLLPRSACKPLECHRLRPCPHDIPLPGSYGCGPRS